MKAGSLLLSRSFSKRRDSTTRVSMVVAIHNNLQKIGQRTASLKNQCGSNDDNKSNHLAMKAGSLFLSRSFSKRRDSTSRVSMVVTIHNDLMDLRSFQKLAEVMMTTRPSGHESRQSPFIKIIFKRRDSTSRVSTIF